jgi:hypothetical protein
MHYSGQAEVLGELGGTVTLIYSAPNAAPQKSRGALLPLLIILFVASYGILTMLVVEQGRTIEAQRGLLQEMLKDSTQLADLKGKMARAEAEQGQAKALAQMPAPTLKKDKEKAPANSSGNNGATKLPSNEAHRSGKSARTAKQLPEKPAEDLQDARRSTNII